MKVNRVALILSLGFVLFAVSSCRKDREVANYNGEYTLSGRVLDEISGQGIPYATVGVIERSKDATSHLGGKTVAYGKTDASGNFSLKFKVDSKENNYELTASSSIYFERTDGGDEVRFTKNGSKNQDIKLLPKGYLNYRIKGNKGGAIMYINYENAGGPYYPGADTILATYKKPFEQTIVGYNIYDVNQNLILREEDTLHIKPHDTTYYLIEF